MDLDQKEIQGPNLGETGASDPPRGKMVTVLMVLDRADLNRPGAWITKCSFSIDVSFWPRYC